MRMLCLWELAQAVKARRIMSLASDRGVELPKGFRSGWLLVEVDGGT